MKALPVVLLTLAILVGCVACRKERKVGLSDINGLLRSNALVFAVADAAPTNYDGLKIEDLAAIRIAGAHCIGQLPLTRLRNEQLVVFENPALELLVENSLRQSLKHNREKGEWVFSLKPSAVFLIQPIGGTTNATLSKLTAQYVWATPRSSPYRNGDQDNDRAQHVP